MLLIPRIHACEFKWNRKKKSRSCGVLGAGPEARPKLKTEGGCLLGHWPSWELRVDFVETFITRACMRGERADLRLTGPVIITSATQTGYSGLCRFPILRIPWQILRLGYSGFVCRGKGSCVCGQRGKLFKKSLLKRITVPQKFGSPVARRFHDLVV